MLTTLRSAIAVVTQQEDINFLLTNRIPRRLATRFLGWFSQLEHPVVSRLSIGAWRLFADLDLSDARETRFRSLHACFVRRLKAGARPIDADPERLVSPCDGIVGASGSIESTELMQIKGSPYSLHDLLGDAAAAETYRDGCYVTLRLTSAMYHRFHAPHDCRLESITYTSGDTWNVNPIALKRIERLFCKNERAAIRAALLRTGHPITLVAVAAILVASIRFSCFDTPFDARAVGPRPLAVDLPLCKGEEIGWFQHGSTIIVFAPKGFMLTGNVREGCAIRAGQSLMEIPRGAEPPRR